MAKCEICGKSVQFGCNVSHSHKKTNKMWRPNVKKSDCWLITGLSGQTFAQDV